MTANRVQAVQGLRRSNAAGPHGTRPTRAAQLADALQDWADEQIPDQAVDAVFDAIDADREVYHRSPEEVGELRAALAAAARHLIQTATPGSEGDEED